MWPTGMRELGIDAAGKIPAELSAEPGRAVGRLTDLGWGERLRAVLSGGPVIGPADGADGADGTGGGQAATDGPVSDDLVEAVVRVLAGWDWSQRPAGVLALPSRSRPELISSLSGRIAELGRLRWLGTLEYAAGASRPAGRSNSAQRVRALWGQLTVPEPVRAELAGLSGPVLLVDDRIDTGWTMTVAARLVREAGAEAVLPLALAVTAG